MRLEFVDIQNFRKLKSCRLEISDKETLLVGANNSGKTSAMNALMMFLDRKKAFSTNDFTLSNWKSINQIAAEWLETTESERIQLNVSEWRQYVPALDVWICVKSTEVNYVSHIIPSLDWKGDKLGVRLIFEPQNLEKLYKDFKLAYDAAKETSELAENKGSLNLWPQTMRDYLDRNLHKHFTVNAYILDPSKVDEQEPQRLSDDSEPLDGYPFDDLFKIHIINAQRGFSDSNSDDGRTVDNRKLSAELRRYFDKHLNPLDMPDLKDLEAIGAIESARKEFDMRINESFKESISELEKLNYPGFSDPKIYISTRVNPLDSLKHESLVQYGLIQDESIEHPLYLPETYNGLGFQNLIYMIFRLISFRDDWMRVGKASNQSDQSNKFIEPLHIVLIEEPEAHLHVQVQQVFIKKAYEVLRNHANLKENDQYNTQLIISTHSSHIVHSVDFSSLRYFKRIPATCYTDVPCAEVVNLSKIFGDETETSKFATRYLKTTHCDLFFADAAILVEGPAERMLVPYFIRNFYKELDKSYISILEIGGSHAHRLKPLIETLDLITLVITDLDPIEESSNRKVIPEFEKGYKTRNQSIKDWAPGKDKLDDVLLANSEDKVKDNLVRIAYQNAIKIKYGDDEVLAIPYTFEDALVLSNIALFKTKTQSFGLTKKMAEAVNKPTFDEAYRDIYNALASNSKKAEMALDLLYTVEPSELKPPQYIKEGLEWLQERLKDRHRDYVVGDD